MSRQLRILAILPSFIHSSIIYVIKPMISVQRAHDIRFRLTLSHLGSIKDIDWADIVIFCRNIAPSDLRFLYYASLHGKKVIYHLDDNFFEITLSEYIIEKYRNPCSIWTLKEFLYYSDLVIVYSEPLKQKVKEFNKNVKKYDGYFDFSLLDGISVTRRDSRRLRITYATGRGARDTAKNIIESAAITVAEKYSDSVEFLLFGADFNESRPNIHFHPFIANYDTFIRTFYQLGCDIGLAPLYDDIFHQSKTNIKYREYSACKVAGIYSNVSTYSDYIHDGLNGLIVDNSIASWINAMEKLILDAELRTSIQKHAYNDVKNRYSFEAFCEYLYDGIRGVISYKRTHKLLPNSTLQKRVLVLTEYNIHAKERSAVLLEVLETCIPNHKISILDVLSEIKGSSFDIIIFLLSRPSLRSNSLIQSIAQETTATIVIDFASIHEDDSAMIEVLNRKIIFCLPREIPFAKHKVHVIRSKSRGGKYIDSSQYEVWLGIIKEAAMIPKRHTVSVVSRIATTTGKRLLWLFQRIIEFRPIISRSRKYYRLFVINYLKRYPF